MSKNQLWLIPFFVFGLRASLHGQESVRVGTDMAPLHLIEAASNQRDMIISGIEPLKTLSYHDPLRTRKDSLLYNRMRSIQRRIPLALNGKIKAYIETYVSANYKPYVSKLQGLAQYYFPIYEKILHENQLPEEIKYISVIESSLNPNLASRAGAVGLWQFMYPTAKVYDLTMNGYIDERKDPYAACYAASRYFMDAYDEFDDWLLALASYNCGRGGVRRAIKRSGLRNPSFWEISPYLPKETQNYIPKFIAMYYTLKHAEEYDIPVAPTDFAWEGEPIMVEKPVNLQEVAQAVGVPLKTIKAFNPAYKRTVIRASAARPKRLVLPQTERLNDSLVYAALNKQLGVSDSRWAGTKKARGTSVKNASSRNSSLAMVHKKSTQRKAKYVTYTVQRGDRLSEIAARFEGASVSRIRIDNRLRNNRITIGQKLRIKTF